MSLEMQQCLHIVNGIYIIIGKIFINNILDLRLRTIKVHNSTSNWNIIIKTYIKHIIDLLCLFRLLPAAVAQQAPLGHLGSQVAHQHVWVQLSLWVPLQDHHVQPHILGGFKKALLQNPREMIGGRIFSKLIRIRARKSELRPESRSYRPKVRVTAGETPESEPNRPEKAPELGLGASTENPP